MSAISRLIWLPEPPAVAQVGDMFVEAPPPEKLPNDDCSICLETLYAAPPNNNNRRVLKHGKHGKTFAHHFHESCILPSLRLKRECPTCRHPIHIPVYPPDPPAPPAPSLTTRAIRRITWELKHFSYKTIGVPMVVALVVAGCTAAVALPVFAGAALIDLFSPSIPSLVARVSASLSLEAGAVFFSATFAPLLAMAVTHTTFRLGYFFLIEKQRLTPLARMIVTLALAAFSAFVIFKIATIIIPAAQMHFLSTHLLPHELADGLAASSTYLPKTIRFMPFSDKVKDVAATVSSCRNLFCLFLTATTFLEWLNSSRLTLDDERSMI